MNGVVGDSTNKRWVNVVFVKCIITFVFVSESRLVKAFKESVFISKINNLRVSITKKTSSDFKLFESGM